MTNNNVFLELVKAQTGLNTRQLFKAAKTACKIGGQNWDEWGDNPQTYGALAPLAPFVRESSCTNVALSNGVTRGEMATNTLRRILNGAYSPNQPGWYVE